MNVIVTGASKGIGRGIAEVLAAAGMSVGLIARPSDELRSVRESIEASGGRAVEAPADLRDFGQTSDAVQSLIERLGGVDALVNNAGVVIRKPAHELSLDDWRTMLETNVSGVFHATKAVLPYLIERQRGHIINVSSISGYMPLPGGSGYAATKYAVTGFSESLFQEVRQFNIKVTTVFPGSVDTASHRHDPTADHTWKVQPPDIGEACLNALRSPPGVLVSRVEVRPLKKGG